MANTININGRRIPLANSVSGQTLINNSQVEPGRRLVIRNGIEAQTIDPYKTYSKEELIDKKGKPVKIDTIPDRTKGSFGGVRSALSKQIITEQVYDLAANCFKAGLEFDEENADWMIVPKYVLPPNWHHIAVATPLLIVLPKEYPTLPPIGFYLKGDIIESPDGHFFQSVYHEADKDPIEAGWKWFCVYVNPGSWKPVRYQKPGDWKYGDNLWTYFSLIKETLNSKGE